MLHEFVDSKFPKWAKVLLCIFGLAGAVYRVFLYVDECIAKKQDKNILPLVVGIIGLVFSPFGFVLSLIDLFIGIIPNDQFSDILR